jgi:hypothetical protein
MLPEQTYEFSAPVLLYQGQGAWYFVTLPVDIAARIRHLITGPRRGWGGWACQPARVPVGRLS